jgi:nucleoside-diphosphate-sugar epimerase
MNGDKILVTGSTGFIGRELIDKLAGKEYEIHTIERYVTGRYGTDPSPDVIKHYANFSDYAAIKTIVKEVKPDYVMHVGAISAVSFSYDHYIEVGETNYLGTINLAEACYREIPNFKQFIFSGTSEEYGMTLKNPNEKLTEKSELRPNSPYAVSKVAADIYLRYMGMAYKFPYTIMRAFNTYGRKANTHFFIERTITQMLKGGKVYLGDPDTIRDWLYVDDHVNGFIKALGDEKAIGQEIQLCTGKGYTTRETAEMIAKITNFNGEVVWHSSPPRPLDARILIGDPSKAKTLLGWEPKVDLAAGLKIIADYWKRSK